MALQTSRSRVYEDFQPVSEWKEEPQNNILVVHLPRFKREQIHINCVPSLRVARVTGERQLRNNKWSRCNQKFKIPQNCTMDKIHANWRDGVVTITMPKETITQPIAMKEEAKTAQEAPKDQKHAASPKAAAEPKATPSILGEKKTEERSVDSLIAQKAEKETDLQNLLKDESTFPETSQKDKETEKEDRSAGEEKEKQNEKKDSISAKTTEKKRVAGSPMKAVKGLSMEQNGDKQLVINIGVAALVLVALGAYISYNLGLKSKD